MLMCSSYSTERLRQTFRCCLTLMLLLLASATAQAADPVVADPIELGKEYTYGAFQTFSGTYTATEACVIKVSANGSDFPSAYSDADHTTDITSSVTISGAWRYYDISLEAGQTVYFYINDDHLNRCTVTFTQETKDVQLESAAPEAGSTFAYGGEPTITLTFNNAVKVGRAQIVAGSQAVTVQANVSGKIVYLVPKAEIKSLVDQGALKEGDAFTVRLTDVRMASDESVLYGTDGTFEISYVCGPRPVELVKAEGLLASGNKFLSYWPTGDERGIIKLTFSGDLQQPAEGSRQVSVNFGEVEGEEYYSEALNYTVNGNVLTCDLTGKLRTPANMVPSGTNYGTMAVKIYNLRDAAGNLVSTSVSGSLGSLTYQLPYEVVKADFTPAFTPKSGTSLAGVKEIEIWTTDYTKLHFDAVKFDYTDGTEQKAVVTTAYVIAADPDMEGAGTITIPVPDELDGKTNITLTLNNLVCDDGLDHSSDFTAKYDAFVLNRLTYTDPAEGSVPVTLKGAQLNAFASGGTLAATTNMPGKVGYATYTLEDLNPESPDEAYLITTSSMRYPAGDNGEPDNTKPLQAEIYGVGCTFYKGHTYRLAVVGYASEDAYNQGATALGTDYVEFEGNSTPFAYSTVTYVGADPESGSTIPASEDAVVTLEYDGMVTVEATINGGMGVTYPVTKLEPIDGDEDGLSNLWKMTVSQSQLSMLGGQLALSVVAKDRDGLYVQGNMGKNQTTYQSLEYKVSDGNEGLGFTITPADGAEVASLYEFTVSSPDGVSAINESYNGTKVVLYKADGTQVATVNNVEQIIPDDQLDNWSYVVTSLKMTLDHPVTEAGSYYLDFPEQFFIIGEQFSQKDSGAGRVNYTVNPTTGIDGVTVSTATQAKGIYTLTGVKLNVKTAELPAGVYVIDGHKVLIKR